MEINYCLKKGKGKGNLYLPSFVVTLFCRRALMSPRSYVARSFVARSFCGALLSRYHSGQVGRILIRPPEYAEMLLHRSKMIW
jgi:hypothetical protein